MTHYHLIFDVSNMFHRSYGICSYTTPNFSLDKDKDQKTLIRKFIIDLSSIIKRIKTENIYLCFDHKSFRKKIDENYKGNRANKDENVHSVLQKIYELCDFKKLNPIRVENLEADDCIALVCERLSNEPKIIISSDEDVRQLIDDNCYVLTPHNKNRTIYKSAKPIPAPKIQGVDKIVIVNVEDIISDKFLKGCKSDQIPSLVKKGFRNKKVQEFSERILKESSKYESEIDLLKDISDYMGLDISLEQTIRQMKLIRLKSDFMPKDSVSEFKKINFNTNKSIFLNTESILSNTIY